MNRMPGLVQLLEQQAASKRGELDRLKEHKMNGGKFENETIDAMVARFTQNEFELRKWIKKLKAAG